MRAAPTVRRSSQLVGRRCSELKDYPGGAELSAGDVRIKLVCELPIPLFNTDRVALEISV